MLHILVNFHCHCTSFAFFVQIRRARHDSFGSGWSLDITGRSSGAFLFRDLNLQVFFYYFGMFVEFNWFGIDDLAHTFITTKLVCSGRRTSGLDGHSKRLQLITLRREPIRVMKDSPAKAHHHFLVKEF